MFALYSEIEKGKKEDENASPGPGYKGVGYFGENAQHMTDNNNYNIMGMLNDTSGKLSDLGPNKSINNVYYINCNNFKREKKSNQRALYSENNMMAIKEELKEHSIRRKDVKGMRSPSPSIPDLDSRSLDLNHRPPSPSFLGKRELSSDAMSDFSAPNPIDLSYGAQLMIKGGVPSVIFHSYFIGTELRPGSDPK